MVSIARGITGDAESSVFTGVFGGDASRADGRDDTEAVRGREKEDTRLFDREREDISLVDWLDGTLDADDELVMSSVIRNRRILSLCLDRSRRVIPIERRICDVGDTSVLSIVTISAETRPLLGGREAVG
jgi:hypothetical protein